MPRFYQEVEAEVDVEIDDFLSSCSSRDINELIEALIEDGYLKADCQTNSTGKKTYLEEEWDQISNKINEIRLRISPEDEELIRNIVKKY